MNYFAKNLKYLVRISGKLQSEIASECGFEESTFSGYVNDKSRPYIDGLIRISNYFKVGETDLLHTNISKQGQYSAKVEGGKKSTFSQDKGQYEGQYSDKKYPKNDKLTVVNEPAPDIKIMHRIPAVITVDSAGNENVVMVPVRARAGYLNGYADPGFIEKLPAYRLPGLSHGTFRLFEVEGLSMYPTLHSGDMIIGQNVDQLLSVRDDRVYVVVTKNDGVVIKRVLNRINKDGKLILKSDNYKERDQYPTIVCDPADVIEMWYAIGFISRQMRPPAEMYNRVVDLEGRLTLLEDKIKKGK